MELNNAQKQAVEYLDGPLLVLAGPGTGKTQLLSSKVAYILKNTDTNPENILCITFTENGSTNMRNRLTSVIGSSAHQVNIGTYHAFGLDLLYRYQQYSPDFSRQLDEAIDEVTGYKIIKNILESLPARDILKKDNIKDILSTISEAKSARLTANDLQEIAKANAEQSALLNAALAPVLAYTTGQRLNFNKALEVVYQPALKTLIKFTDKKPILKNIEPLANYLTRTLKETIDNELQKEKPSTSPLRKWRDNNFELDENNDWRLSNIIANKKLSSIAVVMQKYQEYLENNNLYDFDDMIELTIETLKTDRGFRLSMSEQFQYILLDEFQDTNPAQFELIRLLTDYERPNIMAVGDDDQAIFAFQGANASNLLDFQTHYNAEIVVLTENYRSTQDILDLSRHIADQLTESFAKQHKVNKKLQSQAPKTSSDISRHEFISSDAEYSWVAETINNLIENGANQTDIAIIAPKHKYIAPLLPYLKKHENINISYEKNENILESPAITQLIKLSRFIYNLTTTEPAAHHILELLSFPFWELNPATAIEVAHIAKKDKRSALKVIADSDNPKLQQISDFISQLVISSQDVPLELFLDYLIGTATLPNTSTSPFLEYYKSHNTDVDIYELYSHLLVLKKALSSHIHKTSPKLPDLINFIDDCQEAEYQLTNTSPYQNSANSIQLLSAHKAKGLEFKYVFLIAVDDKAWGNSKGNNNMLALPQNLTQIRHTGRTDDECIRLFFVAVTRAKTHLIMTNSTTDFSGKTANRLQYLSEHEQDHNLISPYLPKQSQAIYQHQEQLTKTELAQNLHRSWVANYQKLNPDLQTLLLKHLENYRLTATDLTTFIDLRYAGPQIFYGRRVLQAPSEPASKEIILGNLIHAVFEKVTKNKISNTEAIEFLKQRLNEESLDKKDYDDLLIQGTHATKISLQTFGDLLRAPIALSEVDFRKHHLQIDDLRITGKIDHIQVDKESKTIKIYDFKTGNHHAPGQRVGWNGDLSLYKYSLQLEFYKLLLKVSPEYHNYQVTEGHILFVKPSESEDKVYDETYHFTDESAKDFLDLAKAVYNHIKTLDFIADDSLNIAPNREVSMKQIRDFIEKVKDAKH